MHTLRVLEALGLPQSLRQLDLATNRLRLLPGRPCPAALPAFGQGFDNLARTFESYALSGP
ncbi:hypothetical protein SBA3_2570006 [Candidatus Sulfopaludibacter sp. SbA3]|nr:hypothetical protein SBA3_2570006 [Candidatus Sulfopaludibacter sp. SbA3]